MASAVRIHESGFPHKCTGQYPPTLLTTVGRCNMKGAWYQITAIIMISERRSFIHELLAVIIRTQI